MSAKDQAQLPHKATFVRLGRASWFALEHSQRSRGVGGPLDERLADAGEENDEIARMGIPWMRCGIFAERRQWSDDQWVAFLRTWQQKCARVFPDEEVSTEERNLRNAFEIYWIFYANLPEVPELPDGAPEGFDMSAAKERVEGTLAKFEERGGKATGDEKKKPCDDASEPSSEGEAVAGEKGAKEGRGPWPFIFFHDPGAGMRDWQTWFAVGLLACWVWSRAR